MLNNWNAGCCDVCMLNAGMLECWDFIRMLIAECRNAWMLEFFQYLYMYTLNAECRNAEISGFKQIAGCKIDIAGLQECWGAECNCAGELNCCKDDCILNARMPECWNFMLIAF